LLIPRWADKSWFNHYRCCQTIGVQLCMETDKHNGQSKRDPVYVDQACTTYGPRAKCGPRKLSIWPSKPKFTYIWLDSWWKQYENWKNLTNLARECFSNTFLARHEIWVVHPWCRQTACLQIKAEMTEAST